MLNLKEEKQAGISDDMDKIVKYEKGLTKLLVKGKDSMRFIDINISQIIKIEPYGRWTYMVKFKDIDRDALITGEKYEEIKIRFS